MKKLDRSLWRGDIRRIFLLDGHVVRVRMGGGMGYKGCCSQDDIRLEAGFDTLVGRDEARHAKHLLPCELHSRGFGRVGLRGGEGLGKLIDEVADAL